MTFAPIPPQDTPKKKKKKKRKEERALVGALIFRTLCTSMMSKLTPCVLIITLVKMTNNYQRLYTKMNFRLSSLLDFVKTIVIMPLFHTRHKTGNSSERVLKDISVIFIVVPTLHSPYFLWPSTLKVKATRDSENVCHGMYMGNSNS